MMVCIYGSSSGAIDHSYIEKTEELGEKLAQNGHSLVFGAGNSGLMGASARGFKRGGGYVLGVVPTFLDLKGNLFAECDEFLYTQTMRERKQIMEDRADAFIVTPGGIGTYEEFLEIYTLKQLGRHAKPIILYNMDGYYDAMLAMIRNTVDRGFMKEASAHLLTVATTTDEVMEQLLQTGTSVDIHDTKYV